MTGHHVVATAGHVDHGKSTLVHALTGMEPDRWQEERRRGLTIDLGFAWTTLPSGRDVAFVDVPGHQRFLANTLAGLGPASVVCFVVAADEGWSAQSSDHRDAIAAFGIEHGVVAVTRSDRAPELVQPTIERVRREFAGTGLEDAPAVGVSAVEGSGLDELRTALDGVLERMPDPSGRLRLWVDRSFSITGAGTVVTGTLGTGTLGQGDRLHLVGADERTREVVVRGLQSRGETRERLTPVDRAAVNLRGVGTDDVHRGDVLVTADAWLSTRVVDVRRAFGAPLADGPGELMTHLGTASVPTRIRPFDEDHARLTLDRALPLSVGDRLALRDPGGRRVFAGVTVLDADPPDLRRRGEGTRRGRALAEMSAAGDLLGTIVRAGAVEEARLRTLGLPTDGEPPPEITAIGGWWVHRDSYDGWRDRLRAAVRTQQERDPSSAGMPLAEVRSMLGHPAVVFLDRLVGDAGLEQESGRVRMPGTGNELGAAEEAIAELETRLKADPFLAPVADDLASLGLTEREIATAVRLGRLLRLADGVILLPTAPALAMRELARLPQPFTTSQAREALGTSRRVAIPLLEYLDRRGWTRRVDAGHREVVR